MANLQIFRQYRISQDHREGTVELWRSATEVACLAADPVRQVLVELRVCTAPPEQTMDARAFSQLVQLAAPLRHRHLLGVIEGGEDEGSNFYVTEFLDGERFDTWLARCNPLPPWLALHTTAQVIEGLCVLAPHPRLLAGVELHHCGIMLTGDTAAHVVAKVADLGLTSPPSRLADPRQIEKRVIQETGRLLLYMLTGVNHAGAVEALDFARHNIAPELNFLLSTIFLPSMQHHPQTLAQLKTLMERCMIEVSPEIAARPERLPPALRPRLPLISHFLTPIAVAEMVADDLTVDARSFDALDPYRHRAVQRSTRLPVIVQLLPPERIMPLEYARTLNTARERISALDHPRLMRVLAWDEARHPEILIEEAGGKWNLESIVSLKGRLTPLEAYQILEECELTIREAESCGLIPMLRNPRQINIQFTGPGGEEALPAEPELARMPLNHWPSFRVRARTWPTTLNFTQKDRFSSDRLVPTDLGESIRAGRTGSVDAPPSARDLASLASWMMGGTGALPDGVRSLIYDGLSPRTTGGADERREFMHSFGVRVGRIVEPVITRPLSRALPAREQSVIAAGAAAAAAATRPVPSRHPREITFPTPAAMRGSTTPIPLSEGANFYELTDNGQPMPGFAEALFGAAKTHTSPIPQALSRGQILDSPSHETFGDAATEFSFLDGRPSDHERDPMAYDPELDGPESPPSRILVAILVILISLVVGGVAAHLNGTAPWLRP